MLGLSRRLLEGRHMTVVGCQAVIGKEEEEWRHGQEDPQSVNQINLDPECNNNRKHAEVNAQKEHTAKAHVGHVGLVCEKLPDERKQHDNHQTREYQGNQCVLFRLFGWEVVQDLLVQLVVVFDSIIHGIQASFIEINLQRTEIHLVRIY